MDTLKYPLFLIFLCCFATISNAQSSKITDLAENRVQEINELITSVNPDAALSGDQKKQIKDLHIKRTEEIQKIKKSDLSETEKNTKIVDLRRTFGRTYSRDILNQEQRKAKKEAQTLASDKQ